MEETRLEIMAIRPGAKHDLASRFILISSTMISWSWIESRLSDFLYRIFDSGLMS